MNVLQIIKDRFSCRQYQDKPIPHDQLDIIIEAARLAPSAKNIQDWRFVIVTDPQIKDKICSAATQDFLAQAPVIIIACTNSIEYTMRCGIPAGIVDVSIALEHIALQATSMGLATCWIGSFEADKVKQILNIPDEIAIVELMTLGYPAEPPKRTTRIPAKKIISHNTWQFTE